MLRKSLIVLVVLVILAGAAFFALVYKPAIDALPPGQAQTFDTALIAHGAELAAIGDCSSCHTTAGGKPFAGGLAVPTPFGTIYSSNITPDTDSGIGQWTEAAFQRAMREGVDRSGSFLYPAFPFDHFTHVSDDDIKALYAYFMTREPVNQTPPANALQFPYSIRQAMAGWDLLFLKKGPLEAVSDQSDEWNRGRYLAEGLGHCAACHSPRNPFGAEDGGQHFGGGSVIDGWYVYPIDQKSPAPTKWDVASLTDYLKNGFASDHGAAAGPMAQVTANLGSVNAADVKAIATYVASQMGGDTTAAAPAAVTTAAAEPPPPLTSGDSLNVPMTVSASADQGETIFATACSSCHTAGRAQPFGGVDLRQSSAINADSPQNAINMVLYGLPASDGKVGSIMPSFAGALGQDQVVALLGYLRSHFAQGKPAWSDAASLVADTISGKTAVKTYSTDGIERMPGAGNMRTMP